MIRLAGVLALLGAAGLMAQNAPAEPTRAQLEQELDAYRRILLDWGGLTHYGSENAELRPADNRVVFLGDEITERWGQGTAKFFPGKPYLNRGITRQTAAQMLVRFRQDVLSLKPKVVIIAAGTNDLGSVMGPSTEGTMAEHFMSMVDLALAHNIRVVLASVTPVCDCFVKQTARRPIGKIISLNNWLKSYAAERGLVYLDYYSALVEGRAMNRALTVDGFLPNDAAYEKMAPLAEKAIAQALAQPGGVPSERRP
ncbi:MAG: SGNH/GDSL hydrolase family protein [Acidobacteria bacterium]|nr:SGNH/GDSL hydrolase family protein [Acidobacteriota bacterium]